MVDTPKSQISKSEAETKETGVEELKAFDEEDENFIKSIVGKRKVLWKSWVKYKTSNKDAIKNRICIITIFRIFVIKKAYGGYRYEVHHSHNFLNLSSLMGSVDNNINNLTLEFNSDDGKTSSSFTIQHPEVGQVCKLIYFHHESVTYGSITHCTTRGPYLDDYLSPHANTQDGTLASYLAQCDRIGSTPYRAVIDYLVVCFVTDDHVFEFEECFKGCKDVGPNDIIALCSALTNCDWFNALTSRNFPLGAKGMFL